MILGGLSELYPFSAESKRGGVALLRQVDCLARECISLTSSNCSAATVARLRAPMGRPWGFPLCPGLKGI